MLLEETTIETGSICARESSLSFCWCDLYLQHSLQSRAGDLFILVEGVGVDVQRGGRLAVAEDTRHRGHIRAARDHQTGGGVPEGMNVQLLQQRFHFGGEVHIAVTRAGLGLFCKYLLVSYYS